MEFKDVEKAMYQDEEFLKYLPILQPEYWKKASPKKRLKIFEELQRIISSLEPAFSPNVIMDEIEQNTTGQNIFVSEDCIIINEKLFKKAYNPYDILMNYVFELEIINNFAKVIYDEDFASTEKGKMIVVNSQESVTGEWDNYWARNNDEFFYQPVTWESTLVARSFTYNLMKYMHKNYSLDSYMSSTLSGLMLSSFVEEKSKERVMKNYEKMKEKVAEGQLEEEKLDSFFRELNEEDVMEMSDDDFFAIFNSKVMNCIDDDTRVAFFRLFIKRELKDFKDVDEVVKNFWVGEHEEHGKFVYIGGILININNYREAMKNVLCFISNMKLRDGLCHEIDDEEFLNSARLCYTYITGLADENCCVEVEYSETASDYYEYRCRMIEHYYNKIQAAIKKSEYFSDTVPYMVTEKFFKYEAYLQYAFKKSFKEAKEDQLASLQKRYIQSKGGNI